MRPRHSAAPAGRESESPGEVSDRNRGVTFPFSREQEPDMAHLSVKLNDEWYHLDLTWDDPITNTGTDMLLYDYFLIDTNQLLELMNKEEEEDKRQQHNFDLNIYEEMKK